jgi:hypothetical protein
LPHNDAVARAGLYESREIRFAAKQLSDRAWPSLTT